MSEVEVVWSW